MGRCRSNTSSRWLSVYGWPCDNSVGSRRHHFSFTPSLGSRAIGEVIHLKDRISSSQKHAKQRHPIFGRQRTIGGIQRIAQDMTLLVVAINAGACAVKMVPRGTCQSRLHHGCALGMERLLVFDQQVRDLSRADCEAHRPQKIQDLWLAHPICIVESQDPCSDTRSKLTAVASWKSCQRGPFLAGGVIFFFTELDVLGPKCNVLHDDILIPAFPAHRQAGVPSPLPLPQPDQS